MTFDRDRFELHSYTLFKSSKMVQRAGRNLQAIKISSVSLAVQTTHLLYNEFVLDDILHCLKIFPNFISASSLHQNGFYLYDRRQTVNQINDSIKISAALIKGDLYILNTIYKPLIAGAVKPSTFIQLLHQQLRHLI